MANNCKEVLGCSFVDGKPCALISTLSNQYYTVLRSINNPSSKVKWTPDIWNKFITRVMENRQSCLNKGELDDWIKLHNPFA